MTATSAPHSSTANAVLNLARLDALVATGLLDSPPESPFDQFTSLSARVSDAPISLISLIDRDRSYLKSEFGLTQVPTGRSIPISHSLCQHVVGLDAPFVVDDARSHPLAFDNGSVTNLGVGAYLGVPVRAPTGQVLGSLCAIDTEARSWSAADVESLATMATAAEGEIALRAERQIHEATKRTQGERMMRLQNAFLANMSHEIRTPLTAILGNAEVLSFEASPDLQEMAKEIRSGGERLFSTLTSILDLAQIEAGCTSASPAPLSVTAHVMSVAVSFSTAAERQGIGLQVTLPPDLPCLVIDGKLLSHVVGHLIGNAIKFTPKGSVSVRVGLEDKTLRIEVEDTGIGIPADELPYLFVPFQQASDGDGRIYEGSGLGLTLAQRQTELMGGRITVHSAPGSGSTFVLSIPARRG